MKRLFPPIGQGNFAVEKFDSGINVVFDCGSNSEEVFKKRIYETFSPDEKIDKVFISHLDDDHVNGLEYLLKNYTVKEVYLPYMTEEDRTLTRAFYHLKTGHDLSNFTAEFLYNPSGTIREYERNHESAIFFVHPRNDDENIDSPDDYYAGRIESGTLLALSHEESTESEWVFIPFNFKQSERKQLFLERINKMGIVLPDNIDEDYWKNHFEQLKAIYKTIPGGINTNSMVVYSGTKESKESSCHFCEMKFCHPYNDCNGMDDNNRYCISCERRSYREGCLYTGDYNAAGRQKWQALTDAFSAVLNHVGTITVPHHGSHYSYRPELSKMPAHLIINSGEKNRYGHPHANVLKDLIKNNACFSWVTENEKSGVGFELTRY